VKNTNRWIVAGILVAGAVALFTAGAAASSSTLSVDPPASWHPELADPEERRFVWGELQNRSGSAVAADAPRYAAVIISRRDGTETRLTALALSVLAAEAALKMAAGK
jgi:hypothetical protein